MLVKIGAKKADEHCLPFMKQTATGITASSDPWHPGKLLVVYLTSSVLEKLDQPRCQIQIQEIPHGTC